MPNDAKLGLVLGLGLVLMIGMVFVRTEPAPGKAPSPPATSVNSPFAPPPPPLDN